MELSGNVLVGIGLIALIVFLVWQTERARPDRQFGRAEDEAKARSYGDESMNQT